MLGVLKLLITLLGNSLIVSPGFLVDAMENRVLEEITASVQVNCHISDARHGTEYGMCTYLMKMREYFRWEKGLGFTARLGNEEIGAWLSEREGLWQGLEGREFEPVKLFGREYDPLEDGLINDALAEFGLVYSGGLGNSGRPHFFLGELERSERREDCAFYVSGREFARDLTSPPAMTRGNAIYVRRESLRRMLWEKLENWRWSRLDNPLGRAFSCYDFDNDLAGSLERMTDREIDTLLLHEQGERRAGQLLGEAWNAMIGDLGRTPGEMAARAVRDHLADSLVTLPMLAAAAHPSSIHFYVGNLDGMRKQLFPGLRNAYDIWLDSGDTTGLTETAQQGAVHWQSVAEAILELHRAQGAEAAESVMELAAGNPL